MNGYLQTGLLTGSTAHVTGFNRNLNSSTRGGKLFLSIACNVKICDNKPGSLGSLECSRHMF